MERKKVNWFVRGGIIAICLLLITLILTSFFYFSDKGTITGGIITLIGFLVILVLSESFDNFSISNVITLNREVEKQTKQNEILKSENNELRKQVIEVATNVSQHQSNANYIGISQDMLHKAFVQQASEEEVESKENETDKKDDDCGVKVVRKIKNRELEALSIAKYCESIGIQDTLVIKQAKLVSILNGVDPISNKQPIYDGYFKALDTEIFLEVKLANSNPYIVSDRLYYALNKVYFYNQIAKKNAHLVLIVPMLDDSVFESEKHDKFIEVLSRYYEPAIATDLLRIQQLKLSKKESEAVVEEVER